MLIEIWDERTRSFIEKYCQKYHYVKPRPKLTNAETIDLHWNTLLGYYNCVNHKIIKEYLNTKITYNDYLTTYWWYVISNKRKLMDSHKCGDCKELFDLLEVHHLTYEHRGEEVKYMDDLITLCSGCHNNRHPEKKDRKKKHRHVLEVEFYEESDDLNILNVFYEKYEGIKNQSVDVTMMNYVIVVEEASMEELHESIMHNLGVVMKLLQD
jgi:5-methylcytosine-specific restriction endonuclease McrA